LFQLFALNSESSNSLDCNACFLFNPTEHLVCFCFVGLELCIQGLLQQFIQFQGQRWLLQVVAGKFASGGAAGAYSLFLNLLVLLTCIATVAA
jgi:hypothetical protein